MIYIEGPQSYFMTQQTICKVLSNNKIKHTNQSITHYLTNTNQPLQLHLLLSIPHRNHYSNYIFNLNLKLL